MPCGWCPCSGYVAWVTEAFGPFWGFLEGLFSWISGVTDNAIYPVMFLTYLDAAWPGANLMEYKKYGPQAHHMGRGPDCTALLTARHRIPNMEGCTGAPLPCRCAETAVWVTGDAPEQARQRCGRLLR